MVTLRLLPADQIAFAKALIEPPTATPELVQAAKRYDLGELVSRITDENRHDEIDTGHAVGKEII